MTFLRVCQTGNPTIVPAQRDPESKGHTTKDELFLRVHACFQSILAWAHLSYNVAFKFVAYRKGTSFAFLVDIWSRRWLRRLLKKFSLLNTVEPETDFYYSQAPISIAGVVQFFFPPLYLNLASSFSHSLGAHASAHAHFLILLYTHMPSSAWSLSVLVNVLYFIYILFSVVPALPLSLI